MDEVFKKTRELGEALLNCETFLKMKEAEDRALSNREAAELMGSFLEKRGMLHEMMQGDNPDPGALKRLSDEIDADQERLQMMDDIVAMTEARNEFNGLINQINQVLQFIVTGRMDEPEGGCTGSCDSCAGCHLAFSY